MTHGSSIVRCQLFCALVKQLHDGGIYLNVGSAVVLPEVFLKAVSVVRNLGHPLAHEGGMWRKLASTWCMALAPRLQRAGAKPLDARNLRRAVRAIEENTPARSPQ